MIFNKKYHSTQARALRTLATKLPAKSEKLLKLATMHHKIAAARETPPRRSD